MKLADRVVVINGGTSMRNSNVFPTWRSWLQKTKQGKAVDSDRGLQLDDSAAAIQTSISGNGVALGRTALMEKDLAEGRLVRPFKEAVDCELAYYLVYRPESESSAPVVAFKEWPLTQAAPAP
jgi:LysR family glycine cleavage system transcriptional activator